MPEGDEEPEQHERAGSADTAGGAGSAASRIQQQALWVDLQIQQAMARGEFDDLPGQGKPIPDLGSTHDPDWWLKKLVAREQISGVLPPSLQLRKDDAELEARLDRHGVEAEVRREVEEFNERVLKARYHPVPGPPLITMPRDVDATVEAWAARLAARRAARTPAPSPTSSPGSNTPRSSRRWFRRR